DECPADSKKETVFSSPFEMIGNPVFRVILWMMGGISLLGNTAVCIISIMQVRTAKSEPLKVAFLWLVANLSMSDLLMGVYLLSVSAMGGQFSGRYCYHDAEWRSSQTCSILGSLAVVSTEVSASTMATMATIRLVSVYFPVRMSSIKRVTYVTPIVCAWCVGILIGTLPLANYRSGYFVKYVVCMPRLFAKVGDASWGYSTFIIVLNFCLFVYMACCYLVLYQRSRKVTKVGKSKSRRLLRTIAVMILTNFCCWIPICIMAFISLAGVKIDNIVYVVCAGVLHPLNSVLNPLIYSDHAVNFMR
uniref:G-protein coupled receptors family 1 profile domain-containing protein n=1 Tax=Ciona savignyi TaxID=51511 RepID=H2YMH5_CIOSA